MLVALWAVAHAETFSRSTKTFTVGPNPSVVVAPDLNGDGVPDIVTANTGVVADPREERPANDQLSVLVSQGPLDYLTLPQLQSDFAPYSVVVANMDVLKAPDLVVGNFVATRGWDVSLFRNLGDNLFEPLHFSVPDESLLYNRMRGGDDFPLFTTPGITSVAVADFNKDTFRDVVATGWSSDVLVYFPGMPDTFLGEARLIPAKGGPRTVQLADFDGDGNDDLAVVLYVAQEVSLWRGDGQGNFQMVEHFSTRGRLPQGLAVGDLNGDGNLDLAVSHTHVDDSIVLFFGAGNFTFRMSQEITLGKERDVLEHEIRDLLLTDLDGDGKNDLAAACHGSGTVKVLLNRSQGTTLPLTFSTESYSFQEGKPRALAAADFDGNGKKDLAVALWKENKVAFLLGN
jgi:hypothetical protein